MTLNMSVIWVKGGDILHIWIFYVLIDSFALCYTKNPGECHGIDYFLFISFQINQILM